MRETAVFLAEFEDGEIHACRSADDVEIVSRPMCGKPVAYRSKGTPETFVCEACIPLLAVELGIDPAEFGAKLERLRGLDEPRESS